MFTSLHTAAPTVSAVQTKGPFARLIARVMLGHIAWRQRQHLLSLDAAALSDIGISRDQALAEAARPIWDVPGNWRL